MIGIWGAGAEGIAAAEALAGGELLVVDEFNADRPSELAKTARYATGEAGLEELLTCAEVIVSPGVPRIHPFRLRLGEAGVPVTSLTARWLDAQAARTIGVTGTKGKSTTSTLLHLLLQSAGLEAQLGGNIGIPLAQLRQDAQVTVAELSSYQCASIRTSPRIAVITSLYEDHLTWHGSKDAYWQDKAKIAGAGCEVLVCDRETLAKLGSIRAPLPKQILLAEDAPPLPVSVSELPDALRLAQNLHNLRLAAIAASAWLGRELNRGEVLSAASRFRALPHRLAQVAEIGGVRWIDDTLSTVPESVIAAAEAFPGKITLILGGEDRGLNYSALTDYLNHRSPLPTLISIPSSGARIASGYEETQPDRVYHAATLQEAVALAARLAEAGSTVLLSPGSPSYDRFKNFEQKSQAFIDAIQKLHAPAPAA